MAYSSPTSASTASVMLDPNDLAWQQELKSFAMRPCLLLGGQLQDASRGEGGRDGVQGGGREGEDEEERATGVLFTIQIAMEDSPQHLPALYGHMI